MVKKIFRSNLAVTLAVLLAAFVLLMGFLYEYFSAISRGELEVLTDTLASAFDYGGVDALEAVVPDERRVTLIDGDGNVIYDSVVDAETMENHSDREEFIEATSVGVGESTRYSSTLTERTIYRAVLLSDGSVLRVSVSGYSVLTLTLGMLQPMLICALAALALSAFISSKTAKKIVVPINELDLEHPLENDVYGELSPLLLRIYKQNDEIEKRMEELRLRDRELRDITSNMKEGLVLLGEDGKIVSINPAAASLFDVKGDAVGRDFICVCRSTEVTGALEKAKFEGHSETRYEKGGSTWQLEMSRTESDSGTGSTGSTSTSGAGAGTVLIAFDVTASLSAEEMRREFTANVSHELKTPLQSIMGSAELLENGLVKDEDKERFIGNIRRESERLVSLIDDIIRLSRLDEGTDFTYENVDIYALAKEEVEAVSEIAERRKITVSLCGEETVVYGVRRLLHEILYNLCDNAVKYNVDGGSVTVSVGYEDGRAFLSVRDTGIGIPKEHIPRIFERFYRVDKSRSKMTGGTGLGLSIVRHAVLYMKGEVYVESEVGVGTEIKVLLPQQI
ncbi:MAG: ATP-binding protein [Clostridia bacterium]|nr:ATP-binding protein [Clostridia bacterium]